MDDIYYDGTQLLSKLDKNGCKPEVYIATSNRSDGKTTFFSRLLINRFKKKDSKFLLLKRYKYELEGGIEEWWKDIHSLFFKEDEIKEIKHKNYNEVILNDVPCGYITSITASDNIKKISTLFNDVDTIFYDEFQSEFSDYANDEVERFISIHRSVARGGGQQSRYVQVILASNIVSYVNPYFITMGITDLLHPNTRFLRGNGFVLEQHFNENAAKLQQESGFMKAFKNSRQFKYITSKQALLDTNTFIEKPSGKQEYIMTMIANGVQFGVKLVNGSILYIDDRPDKQSTQLFALDNNSHQDGAQLLRASHPALMYMRKHYDNGLVRFKDQRCKHAAIEALRLT